VRISGELIKESVETLHSFHHHSPQHGHTQIYTAAALEVCALHIYMQTIIIVLSWRAMIIVSAFLVRAQIAPVPFFV
jgi:hypothetical protein